MVLRFIADNEQFACLLSSMKFKNNCQLSCFTALKPQNTLDVEMGSIRKTRISGRANNCFYLCAFKKEPQNQLENRARFTEEQCNRGRPRLYTLSVFRASILPDLLANHFYYIPLPHSRNR